MTYGDYALALGLYGALIVLALWGPYALVMAYLYLTDEEWRQLIQERLQQKKRRFRLVLGLAALNLLSLLLRIRRRKA